MAWIVVRDVRFRLGWQNVLGAGGTDRGMALVRRGRCRVTVLIRAATGLIAGRCRNSIVAPLDRTVAANSPPRGVLRWLRDSMIAATGLGLTDQIAGLSLGRRLPMGRGNA